MQQTFAAALNQVGVLFILMAAGYAMRKLNIVDDEFAGSLSNLLLNLLIPAMIIQVMDIPFSSGMLARGGLMILLAVIVLGAGGALGHAAGLLCKNRDTADVVRFALAVPNFGFMGYPVVDALLGKNALFSLNMYNLPYYIAVNTIGIYLLTPNRGKGKASFMSALNPSSVSILVGVILFLIPNPLPKFVQDTVNLAGSTVTPLSMLMTGMTLGGQEFSDMFKNLHIYIISFLRLILIPLAVLGAFRLCGLGGEMLAVPALISAMPVAANLTVFSRQTGGDYYTGAQAVFISTAMSMFTIPVMAAVIKHFAGI